MLSKSSLLHSPTFPSKMKTRFMLKLCEGNMSNVFDFYTVKNLSHDCKCPQTAVLVLLLVNVEGTGPSSVKEAISFSHCILFDSLYKNKFCSIFMIIHLTRIIFFMRMDRDCDCLGSLILTASSWVLNTICF